MAMRLVVGGRTDTRRRPCTRCAGSGCAECEEGGTLEAQEWTCEKARYRVQFIGIPDGQLIEIALEQALSLLSCLSSRQAWYVQELLRTVLCRVGLDVKDVDAAP